MVLKDDPTFTDKTSHPCPPFSTAEKVQEDVIASVEWQMKVDRKIGALKAFQGYMWKEGYENGDLKGE